MRKNLCRPYGVCVIAQVETKRWEAPHQISVKTSRHSGEMVLGGGVSPRSSGKRNEPQSGDTSYDTDTYGTPPAAKPALSAVEGA
jgi:hypothetical protein